MSETCRQFSYFKEKVASTVIGWSSLGLFMIALAGNAYAESSGVDFEPNPANTDPGITTDLDLIKEELEFLQEETVSIAAAHEQPISEAPSNVYVITEEDIRQSGAVDIPTVLRRIPGFEVIQATAGYFDLSVRGDNQQLANKMLILVDGRSIYEDIQGQAWWKNIPVTLPEIKRIEVLKGPASVLYGFNAFDGVVNIITKSPEEMKGVTAQVGGGEFDTISSAAVYANTIKDWGYRLSVGYDQTNKWDDRDALGFRQYRINSQFKYKMANQSSLTFSGGLTDANRIFGPIIDFLQTDTKLKNGYASAFYERPNLFIRGWWQVWDQDQKNNTVPSLTPFIAVTDKDGNTTGRLTQNSYNIEAQHALEFGSANRFTYGLNYRMNTGSSTQLDKFRTENRLGVYIQDELRVREDLTGVAGLRMDMDTYINPTYSPRLALIYNPVKNHTFRIAWGVAYRPPTMFETHGLTNSTVFFPGIPPFVPPASIPGILAGNSNLDPEKIMSYEAEYQGWFFQHRLRFRGSFFYNRIKDLIGRVRISTTPSILSYQNSGGSADIYGLETGLEFLAFPWLSGFANYTYQQFDQDLTISDVRRGGPQHKGNAGLRGDWTNGIKGEAAVHVVGAATYPVSSTFAQFTAFPFLGPPPPDGRVGSYVLLNLRGAYEFWQDRAEVGISTFNTLNDKHRESPVGEMIKSRVMGWLTLKY
ncbi:MAG: TonB-dependent receptor [Nitrospirales bacterium]|nr:TonB-dependent receptor [Nitrospirales bacterium]